MIEIISPAGFENFFREVADMSAAGVTEPAEFLAVAERYGLEFGAPEWEADVIRRYGLTTGG
jgi:hypothetical protein